MTTVIDLGSPIFWGIVIVVGIFIMWYFYGGNRDLEVVGLKPLYIEAPSTLSEERVEGKEAPKKFTIVFLPPSSPSSLSSERETPFSVYNEESSSSLSEEGKERKEGVEEKKEGVEERKEGVEERKEGITTGESKRRFGSIGEELTCKTFERIIGRQVQYGVRPNFLKNMQSGRNLELDCYDPETKIGIEYNGKQHYTFVPRFHKSEEDFRKQLQRDQLKRQLMSEYGGILIEVPYTVDTCDNLEGTFKYNSRITRDQRQQRIDAYLQRVLTPHIHRQSIAEMQE